MKTQMSIHRGLAEVKTYDNRIVRATQQLFVTANKKSNEKIKGVLIDDIKKTIQGNFDSVKALIENKKVIKAAIVLSNATTTIEVGGNTYTVAEAIERKNMIALEENLLNQLVGQLKNANSTVENENAKLPEKLETYLQSILGEKDKRTVEDIESHTKAFYSRNEYELVDPCGIQKHIDRLYDEITKFKTEVDYKLSESNSLTMIEVDLVGDDI